MKHFGDHCVKEESSVTQQTFIREDLEKSSLRVALPQVLAVMIKNLLLISCGLCSGFPTIMIPGVSGQNSDEIFHFSEEQISWIGSLTFIWIAVGCLLSGVITEPFGRKRTMQITSVPLVVCWLIYAFSNAPWQIFFALSLAGFAAGLLEAPVVTYVAEITQPHLRGMLAATAVFSILLGSLISYVLGTFLKWRTTALWSIIPSVASFCLLFFIPESPHWLIKKNKLLEARTSLAWLRGWASFEDVESEFQALLRNINPHDKGLDDQKFEDGLNRERSIPKSEEPTQLCKKGCLRSFTKKNFLLPLSLMSFMFFLSSFTGILTMQTYAVNIFATLQVPINEYHATVLLGISTCLGCLLCVIVIPYFGKRITGFISIVCTGICFITVATYAYIKDIKYFSTVDTEPSLSNMLPDLDLDTGKWIPLVFLNISAFMSYIGLKAIPWILIGEVFPLETRIAGSGVTTTIAYSLIFLSNKMFFKMVSSLTLPGTFWLYGCLSLFGFLILYFVLPETEGKTLQEITDHFSGVAKLDNKVGKTNKCTSQVENGSYTRRY